MMGARLRRLPRRAVELAAAAFILGLVTLAIAAPVTYVAVHETAQPEFCDSCHIMEPYYDSWLNSSHADVGCIECHYEPGAVETFEGKFKALSQLAKYVTRTAGTKPWAEVSDTSCMRSGCHSVRMLEGEVKFGRVSFDHRHHLLETRRGKRLRCVSCHSQIVQGEHVSVTEAVCFMCHFMPLSDGSLSPEASDCETCHGSPSEGILVNERPFSHAEYVGRGVDCRECHSPVVEGSGTVRSERCHSCHAEVGHIERIGETPFLHEMHVTDHKVECFECHDEIRHGLLPLKSHEPVPGEGCGSCHGGSHGAASLLYAGTGAVGVEDLPSRMYETRVVCEACHTGRTDTLGSSGEAAAAGPHGVPAHAFRRWDAPPAHHGSGTVAAAGNLDCVHCHGPDFDGMVGDWQETVGEQLERIGPMLSELEDQLPAGEEHPAFEPYWEARQNLELVTRDGSRGAHNVTYALSALQAGAERIDRSLDLLGIEREDRVADGFPFLSKDGCSVCHLGIEEAESTLASGRPFPHDRHVVAAGLDCDACHSVEQHGEPSFPRADCASCHHSESEERDAADCAACHGTQEDLLRGTLPELEGQHAVMGELECSECHGDPPAILRPSPRLCVLCHEEGYDRMQLEWQGAVAEQLERLVPQLEVMEREVSGGADVALELVQEARREVDLVVHDGSRGAHNPDGALSVLLSAAESLDRARQLMGIENADPAANGFPFRSANGCSTCHLGIERTIAHPGGESFPHRRHLEGAALDCDACHSVESHGEPAFDRADCADCHHQETPAFDPWECSACHADQTAFVDGTPSGADEPPAPMAAKECTDCHGDPPDIITPSPALCVLCHEAGYDELPAQWRARTEELAAELAAAIEAAGQGVDPAALDRARAALAAVERDGSHGAHNSELAASLLQHGLDALKRK
jgi:nitrate/TMAO reductase-like tetraheme cytochrome c subunit